MKTMAQVLFVSLLAVIFSSQSIAAPPVHFRGMVEIEKGKELYVDWLKPQPGLPVVVLLNGLTYSTKYWDSYALGLEKRGVGVLRYDMKGMGETLSRDIGKAHSSRGLTQYEELIYRMMGITPEVIERMKKAPLIREINYSNQVRDLALLLDKLGLSQVSLVGLSYGGAIGIEFAAQHPGRVKRLVAMAPFTEPMAEQDRWIRQMITWTRVTAPWNPASDDDLYDFYLRLLVYATYPAAEKSTLDNPYKLEATFRLAQGIRKWNSNVAVLKLGPAVLDLVVAEKDQYIKRESTDKFWKSVPQNSQSSFLIIQDSEHKIPEAVPGFAAAWTIEVATGNALISSGRNFEADPKTGKVKYSGGEFTVSNP